MALGFGVVTLGVLALFVRQIVVQSEIRSGLFTYAVFTGAAAVGMWRQRRWGRGLVLVIALGNAGLGTLALFAVLFTGTGAVAGPIVLLVVSVALAYLVSRPVYEFPDESSS